MNTIGNKLKLTLFGASHDSCIGCVIDGLPAGLFINEKQIEADLSLRKPTEGIGTPRIESDIPTITGIKDNFTCGTPVVISFTNENTRSSDYEEFRRVPRPGHADYPAICKFGVNHDIRGGGMFSGRMTTPLVAAGAILRGFLQEKGIEVGSYITQIGKVVDSKQYTSQEIIRVSRTNAIRAMSQDMEIQMKAEILAAKEDGDSVGGIVRCIATGVPAGTGEPFFDTLDGDIAKAVFAIPGVKGVSFGSGFMASSLRGSENNDCYYMDNNAVHTKTNHAGGILGGMANGAPIDFLTAFKPTPSIAKQQNSVNLMTMADAELNIRGRHDPCIATRGAIVVEAMTIFTLSDFLLRGGFA